MNDDKNLLGRVIALALILGAAYGAQAIARGGFSCPLGGIRCGMSIPAANPAPAVDLEAAPVEPAAPVEKEKPGEDEDATLEKKAPVLPPMAPGKNETR